MSCHSISASVTYKNEKKQGTAGCTKRICWISSRTISIARGIATKGESSSRYIDSKYARNGKDEESACTTSWWDLDSKKLRENQETIQQLTSQLQQWQEQMNSVNSSWEFQDIESNYGGRLSHVSTQPEMIPSSRALLNRDKRLPLDTWNQSRVQENVVGSQFSTFDSPRDFPQRISCDNVQRNREAVPLDLQPKVKTSLTSEDGQKIMAQFQCPCLRQDRWLRVLNTRLIFRRNTWSDSKDSNYRNYKSTGSLILIIFWCGKQDSKHRSQVVLIFRRKLCYGSKKWRWLILWMGENPHDQYMEKIFQTLRCWTRRLHHPWTRSSRIPSSKRRSASRNRKLRKRTVSFEEDRSPSWSMTTFEWLVLMTQY